MTPLIRRRYHVLDTHNRLDSVALLTSSEIKKRFQYNKNYSVSKLCERQILLEGRYILVENDNSCVEEETFDQHLFHEDEWFLYYLTNEFSIIIKSTRTEEEMEIQIPKNKIYHIDQKTYDLNKIYKKYFKSYEQIH